MTQITSGLRGVLSAPSAYDWFQHLMGARVVRRDLIDNFIRPAPGQAILDIGCGTARIADYFPPQVRYFGYDISERYIAYAQRRLATRGEAHARLFTAAELPRIGPIDTALAIGVLHHLSDPECEGLFALVRAALKPGGRFITYDGCYVEPQNPIARLIIRNDRGRNVREPEGYMRLARTAFREVKGQVRHRAWIPYTGWIMESAAPL